MIGETMRRRRLAGQYTNKSNPNVVIQVHESSDDLEVVEVGTVKRGCRGKLTTKVNDGKGSRDINVGALVIDSMFSNPKGSGIGAILVYEYALHANRLGKAFLGISLGAGKVIGEPSPLPFYYKMGFWDTNATTFTQQDDVFKTMSPEQQTSYLTSLPMRGVTFDV